MPTVASAAELRSEFDEIASLMPEDVHLSTTDRWVLRSLPARRDAVLEIGCGAGHLTRHLATQFARAEGIDLSPAMLAAAARRAPEATFAVADLFAWLTARPATYDCIVTVATLHHVDFAAAAAAMARALRPGGRLLVVDLCDRNSWRHAFTNLRAIVMRILGESIALATRRTSFALRRAYRHHGARETYLTIEQVRALCAESLPGAVVTPSLYWRYTLRWDKR